MSVLPGVVYATPDTPPIIPEIPFDRFGFSLWLVPENPNLSSWQLTDGEDNGIILMRGIEGLGKPEVVDFAEDYAAIDGEYYFGSRTPAREVFLPLHLFHDGSSEDWVARDRALFKVFRREQHARLYCQHPDGTVRSLRVRYIGGANEALDIDPAFFGWATYGIRLKAAQPFWEQEMTPLEWGLQTPVVMYGATAPALPIGLNYRTADSATLTNPGDIPAWPRATLVGPVPSGAQITINGGTIQVPFSVAAGSTLVIDYSPREQSAILNGATDMTKQLGSFDFRRVPADSTVSVGISVPGTTGKLRIEMTALFERAW